MEKTRHVSSSSRQELHNTGPGYWKLLTTKASNRASVHGVKPPVLDILDEEEVQKEIQRTKQETEAKRKQIEKTLGSHFQQLLQL